MLKQIGQYWSTPEVAYQKAWELQLEQVVKIAAGNAPPTVFFLEHQPIVTIGKGGSREHLTVSEALLRSKGVECIAIDRGGDITFHGPGQLVVYPMLSLVNYQRDVHLFVRRLEEVGIKVLGDYGIPAKRSPQYTGVWVGDQKIMAIGVGVKKWVTFHGLAFNFQNDLEGFRWIIPCGIRDKGVTSLHLLLNREISRLEIEAKFRDYLQEIFDLQFIEPVDPFRDVA